MVDEQQRFAKIMQAEIYGQEMKKLEQEYGMLMMRLQELEKTVKALDDVIAKKKFKAMVPLGSGIFLNTEVNDVSQFLVAVSSKYLVKMDPKRAREFLQEQKKLVEDAAERLEKQFEALEEQLQKVVNELQEMERETESHNE